MEHTRLQVSDLATAKAGNELHRPQDLPALLDLRRTRERIRPDGARADGLDRPARRREPRRHREVVLPRLLRPHEASQPHLGLRDARHRPVQLSGAAHLRPQRLRPGRDGHAYLHRPGGPERGVQQDGRHVQKRLRPRQAAGRQDRRRHGAADGCREEGRRGQSRLGARHPASAAVAYLKEKGLDPEETPRSSRRSTKGIFTRIMRRLTTSTTTGSGPGRCGSTTT